MKDRVNTTVLSCILKSLANFYTQCIKESFQPVLSYKVVGCLIVGPTVTLAEYH